MLLLIIKKQFSVTKVNCYYFSGHLFRTCLAEKISSEGPHVVEGCEIPELRASSSLFALAQLGSSTCFRHIHEIQLISVFASRLDDRDEEEAGGTCKATLTSESTRTTQNVEVFLFFKFNYYYTFWIKKWKIFF